LDVDVSPVRLYVLLVAPEMLVHVTPKSVDLCHCTDAADEQELRTYDAVNEAFPFVDVVSAGSSELKASMPGTVSVTALE
jgi:hypothetical protein